MLHYKASDIIKRAKDIADLRGTNFISDEECLSLLNESWTNIYSKLITLNDKAFLNKIEIFEGENALPEDFYQLGFVVDRLNQPIERFTVGSLGSWYELVNGNIQLNNSDRAYLYYYSVPATLTFPKPTVHNTVTITDGSLSPDTPLFYCKPWEKLIAANGTYSYKSSKFKDWFGNATQGILDKSSSDNNIYNVLVDYNGNQVVYPVAKKTAESSTITTAYYRLDGEDIKVKQTSSNTDENGFKIYSKVYYHKGDNDWAVLDLQSHEYYQIKTEDNTIPLSPARSGNLEDFEEVVDGHIYTETYDGYFLDGNLIKTKINTTDYRYRTGVVFGVDYNTGYGAILGDVQNIYSIFPDTELNFPNNLYYNILSYQLALAFACKQSKETVWIEKQLASNWETFFDTLNRDCFGQSHVINTYRGTYV